MKWRFFIACTLSAILVGCADEQVTQTQLTATRATAASEITNPDWETYVVGSEISYPPFEFPDEYGRPIGFEVDLLREIGKAANFNVRFVNTRRGDLSYLLNQGQFQIAASAYAIEESDALGLSASNPFIKFKTYALILDNTANAPIQSVGDLQGKSISVNRGSANYNTLAEKITGSKSNVVPADSFYLSLKNVYTENATAALGDGNVLSYYSSQYPTIKTRLVALDHDPAGELVFLVKKDNYKVLNKINTGLKIVKQNGTYDKLTQKWFGKSKSK